MSEPRQQRSGRLQLLLIAAVFLGPLLVAAWLYFQGPSWQPSKRTNHGELLQPIVNIRDELSRSPLHAQNADSWVLLYSHDGPCEKACRDALYTSRQSRLMLGREMDRLKRVFLRSASAPDTVFPGGEHPDLITTEDSRLNVLLENKRPTDLPAGGYFLIDPLGNLVMYFRPDLDPADMVDDIKHLLRLSRIG
ncbi:MAG: hypothetical protein OEM60_02640 [Gammaproteobacteria bacterium]|nr:hypothetical protein [Gammaproteobacteria bacterium]MDH3432736.1 hypothetical protein [Gammaproteobacteria bacterium]